MSESDFDVELQELRARSVDRLMMVEVFDESAFRALLAYLDAKAGKIRSEHVISKQVLSCLVDAPQAIRSRAEYLPELRRYLNAADEFDQILGLMIIGETRANRSAPRVI